MSAKIRAILWVALGFAAVLSVIGVVNRGIVQPAFEQLERAQALEDGARARAAIQGELRQLDNVLGNWAEWNDAYAFADSHDPAFIASNLGDWRVLEKNSHLNLCFIFARDGRVLYGGGYDSNLGGSVVLAAFAGEPPTVWSMLQLGLEQEHSGGLLRTEHGLLLLAARPILTTQGTGPARGMLVFGRFLDEALLRALAAQTQVAFALLSATDPRLSPAERGYLTTLRAGESVLQPGPEGALFVYEPLLDLTGQPAALLRTPIRQDISTTARRTSQALMGTLGLAALALLLGWARIRTWAEPAAAADRNGTAWGTAALVILIGLTSTYGLFAEWRQRSQHALARDFHTAASEEAERVVAAIQNNLEDLNIVRHVFEGFATVSRQQFRDFVTPILEQHSFRALEWLPRVPRDQRAAYEAAARREGLEGFQFTERDAEDRLAPAADRAEYFPVYYLEPYAGNAAALGFAPDPAHPARGAALAQARDHGQLVATGRYVLVQESVSGQRFSILVFAPVYDGPLVKPEVEERRQRLRGFVLGVMRVGDMVADALRAAEPGQLAFRLLDLTADSEQRWLYDHPSSTDFQTAMAVGLRFHRDFSLADRVWRIEIAPNAAFVARHHDQTYRWVPATGGLLTLLAALYLFTLVSQRRRAELLVAARTTALRASEARFRHVVEHAPFGFHFYRVMEDDRLVFGGANPAADAILKFDHADCVGKPLEEAFPALVPTEIPTIYRQLARAGGAHRWRTVEYRDHRIAGAFEVVAFQTAPGFIAVAFTDITERQQAEARLRLAAAVFEAARDAIVVTDTVWNIVAVNPAFTTLTGYAEADVRGRSPRLLWAERQPEGYFEAMGQTLAQEGMWQGEFWARCKGGQCRAALASLGAVRDSTGRITHHVGVATDITALKVAEQRIEHLAYYDALTDLPNRALLAQRAEFALALAARRRTDLALLFLDLDQFKEVNDSLGHAEGDALLVQAAARLRDLTRAEDTACRLGGDEFVLLLPDAGQENALRVADKLLAAFRQPFAVAGHALRVTTSVGIALYPHDGANFAELLKNADTALYRAKQDGRNTRMFYDRQMNAATFERLVLESELRQAIAAGQLRAYYQPKVRLSDGHTVGAEALVRWQHPDHGLIPPGRFIPAAEASDLIVELGGWMLAEVCRQLAAWRATGLPPLTVAVNLAARHFRQPDLADSIRGLLEAYGLPPRALELELTESSLLEAGSQTAETLLALERLGMGLVIDDFGTGYSSLSYLKRLPLTALKIDQSFVRDLVTDPDDRTIAAAIVALGHGLGLKVVAEGVETGEQRRILLDQGCDLAQGYLFGRPEPPEAFATTWLGAGE
ncbi:MAG: EAL domain-containing protein [Candidatus Contendobacter sp.]